MIVFSKQQQNHKNSQIRNQIIGHPFFHITCSETDVCNRAVILFELDDSFVKSKIVHDDPSIS